MSNFVVNKLESKLRLTNKIGIFHRFEWFFEFRNTMNCDDVPCEYSYFFFVEAHSRDFTFETMRFTWFSLTYNNNNFSVTSRSLPSSEYESLLLRLLWSIVVIIFIAASHCQCSVSQTASKQTQITLMFSDRILWFYTLQFEFLIIFNFPVKQLSL